MAYTAVTYTFSNSTTADATQVNQNYTDIINGLSDGTKDINVNAGTFAGTLTANGNVAFGNASSDDVTITGSLASSLSVKANATHSIGGATSGLLSIYLGATGTYTARIIASASQTATYTLTLPTTVGTKGHIPYNSDGSGTLTWVPGQYDTNAVTADYQVLDGDGYKVISVNCNSADRTVTLPTAADNKGRTIEVHKTDSGAYTVTIDGEGAETIDGATTAVIRAQYGSIRLTCDGTSWISDFPKLGQSGAAIAAGYVGQVIRGSVSAATSSTSNAWQATSVALATGVWSISCRGSVPKGAQTLTYITLGAGHSTDSSPQEPFMASSVNDGTNYYVGVTTTTLNNTTGSINVFLLKLGSSLNTTAGTVNYCCTRIA